MACVTLKRPFDFDAIYSPHSSPGGSGCSPRAHKRRKLQRVHLSDNRSQSIKSSDDKTHDKITNGDKVEGTSSTPGPFVGATPPIVKEDIARYVRDEIRRIRKTKLLQPSSDHRASDDGSSSDENPSMSPSYSFHFSYNGSDSTASKDEPTLSYQQVVNICEEALSQRDLQVRQEYEKELSVRKAEQYDAFAKFSDNELNYSHHADKPTYLS